MAQANNNTVNKVPRRILGTLLSSLSAGVVPRVGAPYIAIGRTDEIEALTTALDRVADGEGSTKFIIGRYGSGKSFLLQTIRNYVMAAGIPCSSLMAVTIPSVSRLWWKILKTI